MSVLLSTIARPAVTNRASAFFRLFSAGWNGIARYFVRHAALARLREAEDTVLRDIGLARSEIEPAVRGLVTHPDRARN